MNRQLTLTPTLDNTAVPVKKKGQSQYIYSHPQTHWLVVSPLFSVARYVGRPKLGLKPAQLYIRLSIILLSQQANHVSSGITRHYVVAFACLHFFSLIYIYIYIYIYIFHVSRSSVILSLSHSVSLSLSLSVPITHRTPDRSSWLHTVSAQTWC